MVVALCDRLVVAILGDSQRHQDHTPQWWFAPEAPGWDKNVCVSVCVCVVWASELRRSVVILSTQ